jgi:inorganic pyrophosphatase
MNLDRVGFGRNVPDVFNVIIEIPMIADPVKYAVNKETGAHFRRPVHVDRRYITRAITLSVRGH